MSIYQSAVEKPISTMMIFLAVIVIGIYSYITLPVDQYPKMDPPYITVMSTYPGAVAEDIEQNVTKILEDQLNSVDDLKEMTSTSYDNLSVISMEFEWGIDLATPMNDVRDAVDKSIDDLPDDIDRPTIMRMSTSMMPILIYAITANESFGGLYKIMDDKVIMRLNRVDGVAQAYVSGLAERVVYIDLDPNKLDAYGLTLEGIGNAIKMENQDMSAGNVKIGYDDYILRVEGEFDESDEIKDVVIALSDGRTVKIKDLAEVRDTLQDITLEQLVHRQPGGMLLVTKTTDANAVQVATDCKKQIAQAMKEVPTDIQLTMIRDSSDFILSAINNLMSTLMYALLSVVVVVFIFLGRWRSTFVIAMTIPISMIVAFIYLWVADGSLNMITLMSLSIAIGMVVDDAIVVLENVTKHVDRGSRPREAAIYGTNEVWTSVIVTTLVTIAVFFPLTLVSGQTGVFFNPLGWIICICVSTSTATAISLTPMLASKFLRLRDKAEDEAYQGFSFYKWSQNFFDKIDDVYEKIVTWVVGHKAISISGMTAIFFLSLLLVRFISTEYFPMNDDNSFNVYIKMQQGQRVERTKQLAMVIDSLICDAVPEMNILATSYGEEEEASFASMMSTTGTNVVNMRGRLVNLRDRERSVFEVADVVRGILKEQPDVLEYEVTTGAMSSGTSNNVDIEIFGHDFTETINAAQEIAFKMKQQPGAEDVLISRGEDKNELQVYLDREKLARHGLSTTSVETQLRYMIYGYRQSEFKEEGEEYDIIVRYDEQFRDQLADVYNMLIVDAYGEKIRLQELGEIVEGFSPPKIERKSKQRYLIVQAYPAAGYAMGDIAEAAFGVVADTELPASITVYIGGSYEDQQESFQGLIMLLMLSLMLVYIVMAAEFESFYMPFIIMLAIPFAFTGVILGLLIARSTLSIISALGAIMLVGIVTKNGIVLIDFINMLRERGQKLEPAVIAACRSRLRPVLMTSLTTILGMVPMALSVGEGSETWKPMGVAVIGGMVFSTMVTLLIVPAVYTAMNKRNEGKAELEDRKQYKFMAGYDPQTDLPKRLLTRPTDNKD